MTFDIAVTLRSFPWWQKSFYLSQDCFCYSMRIIQRFVVCLALTFVDTLDEDTGYGAAIGFTKLFILVKKVLDLVMIA